jgi:GTP1/Obg family GTP-binding protein
VTVSQVLSSLHQILLSVGGNYQEIMWDTPDAREIKDFYRREAVNAIADRHAYAVVIRLWPEMEGCPWAQHYFAGMEA